LISRCFAPSIVIAVIVGVFIVDSEVLGTVLLHYYSHDYISYFLGGVVLFYLLRSVPE
jgi:hypothetical protein